MTGFFLNSQLGGIYLDGTVVYKPGKTHKVDKQNNMNPTVINRKLLYAEDKIVCEAMLDPVKYFETIEHILSATYLEIVFMIHHEQIWLSVDIAKLPKLTDNGRWHDEKYTFEFRSVRADLVMMDPPFLDNAVTVFEFKDSMCAGLIRAVAMDQTDPSLHIFENLGAGLIRAVAMDQTAPSLHIFENLCAGLIRAVAMDQTAPSLHIFENLCAGLIRVTDIDYQATIITQTNNLSAGLIRTAQ